MIDSNTNIEYTISPSKHTSLGLAEIWRYRELFYYFTWRDIKVKYKQTLLGFLWAILQPLAIMAIFVVFFSNLLHIPTDNIPSPIFYFSGLLLWNLFSGGLSSAANSMIDNANIIKKVYFPRLIIPFSSVLVALFDFLMALLIFVFIIVFYSFSDNEFVFNFSFIPYYIIATFITIVTTLGLGTLIASMNVKYRDFRYVVPFSIQFMMFISPVIYPVSILGEHAWLKYLFAINPLSGALHLARIGFTNSKPDLLLMGISISSALLILFLGIFFFRKTEAYFADLA